MTNGIIGLRKRITAAVLSLVIAFGSLPVISAFAESDEAFKGFSYWSASGGELSAVSGISGYGAGISQNSGKAASLTSELISVKSGRKYKAGVSVSSSATNADAELTVAFFGDEEGKNAVGETLSLEKISPTADFSEISGDFTPPEGVAYARLIIKLGENGKSGDEYKLDNAYLYIYGTAAPIYADEAVPGYSAGEWARYPDGNGKKWENTASRYIETVDDGCGGDGALHIVNTGIEGDMWLTVVPDSVPEGSYTVRMKVKGSVTAPGQTFRFADFAHIDIGVGNLFADRVSYDDWTDFSYDYESNGTNRFLLVFSQYNGLSDVYIDSLKVVNKETGKDILNGKGDFCLDGGYNLVTSNNLAKNGDFEDIVYTYLSPDKFNDNFDGAEVKEEPLKWTLNDNYTGDTLVLSSDSSHGGVLEMTKGASASAGAGWVTLSSPNISIEQGTKYRFSADLKGIGSNPYYIITAYWFFDNGTAPVQVKPAGGEGNLSDGWKTVAADLEAPQNAKEIQLRIVFQGAASDKMLFDNASLCPLGMSASLDGWREAGYSSPDPENCYVRLEDNGNADAGSVHIYQDYEKNTARARAGISYMLKGLENGKTYVMELWLKGATQTAGDPLAAELYWGLGNWAKSGNGGLLFDNVNYSEWTKISYEFTVKNAQWAPLCISPGGYAGVDCYIDNVSVYDKSDTAQTNLISNGGFYSYSQPDISRQLIQNGNFENMRVLSAPGWSFSGKTDYDKASSVISFGDNSAAVSYRYNVEGGQIFRTAVNGSGGRLKITFDTGKECEPESSGGIFIVPDGAKYMRVSYISESSATLKGITLTLLENPENYDFEIKDPESERPLNWQYYCGQTDSGSYSLKYAANDGVNGSGALRLTAEKDNDGFAVAYGKRMSAQANGVYRVTFQGKYSGDGISVYPYIRTYNKKGNDTTETSSYNWLTAANSQNNDGEWHSYTADFTAGGDTAFYEVRFEVRAKTAGAKLLFDNISVVYLGDSTDPNLDFESGENGAKVFNWNMYERRENPNKPGEFEEGSFGAYTAVKAEGASKDGSAAVHISKPQAGDVQLYLQSIMLEVGGNAGGSIDISYTANEGDILSLDGDFTDNYYKKHIGPVSFRYSGGKWQNLLTADKAEFYFFESLIENSGFTSGIDGWEQNALPAGSKDTISAEAAGYDGAALKVTHSKASGDSVYKVRTSGYVPVAAGGTYHLRFYVKASGNMRLGASLRGNGSSVVPAESGLNTVITNSTDGWQQMNYTFTLPQDATLTGVKVQLDNAFYSSDAEILYDSIAFYRVCEPGDVNADGSLDIRDLIHSKKVMAGTAEYVSPNAADINGNGHINIIDSVMIKRLLLGLTDYGKIPYVAMIAPDIAYSYNDYARAYLTAEKPTVDDFAVRMTDSATDSEIVLECPVEGAAFKVEYGTKVDFSDAVTVNTSSKRIAVNNLLRNTEYYVRITATANGITKVAQSSFKTADIGPRVMTVGGVTNVRDLGGYETSFGKTTLQGLAFRGAQLDIKGVSRLTAQGAELLGTDIALGLEIDLRTASETGGLTKSVVPTAAYLNSRIGSYTAAFSSSQKELFRQIFASYADVNNYPIYVHCVYGADRTGTVCYILNALLGVDEKTLIQDYIVQNVPGFDIGMLGVEGDRDISVVPGGSYDGSTAVEIRSGDKKERYFQQLDTDAVKFVLGDTAVKATGYFKVTAGNTEPKIWLGFGKSYGGGNSVGLHFANYLENGKADSGESFTARDDGWYYFEKTVDTGTFNNKINSMTELVWVKYMCGIDARTNTGAARFDNITCEIISSAEPGDANNDGEINILDMVRMKKYSAGNESFENITRGMWLTENTDGAAALAALKKVIIGASSEYGK